MLKSNYVYIATLVNFKRVINLENFLLSLLFVTMPLLSFGIIVGGYVLMAPVLYLFIWGITAIFITTKDNIKGTYIDMINHNKTKADRLYNWLTFYAISLAWVIFFSLIGLSMLFMLYRPGGIFHSELFNPNNNFGILILDFWYVNFIYTIVVQFTLYFILLDVLHRLIKDNKHYMITIIGIAMFSLAYQGMFNVGFSIDNSGHVTANHWLSGNQLSKVISLINPQTHIGNMQQLLLHQASYELTDTGVKLHSEHYVNTNILSLSNDIRWNITIFTPLIYIALLSILNTIISIWNK